MQFLDLPEDIFYDTLAAINEFWELDRIRTLKALRL